MQKDNNNLKSIHYSKEVNGIESCLPLWKQLMHYFYTEIQDFKKPLKKLRLDITYTFLKLVKLLRAKNVHFLV